MGLLRSLLKIAHPVRTARRSVGRAVIPRPVRKAMRVERMVTNPSGFAKGTVKGRVIGAVDDAITPERKRR